MSFGDRNQPLSLSLLDRLLADPSAEADLRLLKQGVERDLRNLLNTRWRCESWPPNLEQLEQSLVNYGLPDFLGTHFTSPDGQESLRTTIEAAIRLYEPRLTGVEVMLTQSQESLDRKLTFHIRADLQAKPRAVNVLFETTVEIATGDIIIKDARSMSDELLANYNQELDFFRHQGKEFAKKHPSYAKRIGVSATGGINDPHVERLIEAFALMNARTRHKLDDDFPELAQALLQVAYPHYLAPIPSMAVVKLEMQSSQAEPATIARHTILETEARFADGNPCRYRTCYPVTLLPARVRRAELKRPPFSEPEKKVGKDILSKTRSVLRLSLESFSPDGGFSQWDIDSIRFFINAKLHSVELYELLLNNTLAVRIADTNHPDQAIVLPRECLAPVGFEANEEMLPCTSRSFPGYGLLTEYFAFPQKFLFFDLFFDQTVHAWRDLPRKGRPKIAQESARIRGQLGSSIEIIIYLDTARPELEPVVSADTFELGCTPIVNLFSGVTAHSQRLNHTTSEYHVVPGNRKLLEIYSIDHVQATGPYGESIRFEPFYSFAHAPNEQPQRAFWHAVRRRAVPKSANDVDHGTEMHLSLVDLEFSPSQPADWMLEVQTTCLNRDLPDPDPQKFGEPTLGCFTESAIASITWLEGPTVTLRPSLERGILWKLISHLNLNHLSLTARHRDDEGNEDTAHALKEILALYDFADSDQTKKMIQGIQSVTTNRDVGRIPGGLSGGLCRGIEVSVQFDEQKFEGQSVYLFASILERFLALYCSINSFSRLVARTGKGQLRRWTPRAGDKPLLCGTNRQGA